MKKIEELISNSLPALSGMASYAAILGESPSKGARSPLLWNAAFKAQGISCEMVPMDVSRENLADLLQALEDDGRFIGGAVAVPHKESIADWLRERKSDRLSPEALAIGAVNSLYRNAAGELCATNTDGEGALVSLKTQRPDLNGLRILLIGPGGAGKAVAAFVKSGIGDQGILTIAARSCEKIKRFADSIGASLVAWPPSADFFSDCDVVFNCTTIGSDTVVDLDGYETSLVDFTPLAELDQNNEQKSMDRLRAMVVGMAEKGERAERPGEAGNGLVFDIIYDPSPTKLLALSRDAGLGTLDGGMMNLEQAVLAFGYATGETGSTSSVREAMEAVRQSF